MTIPLRSYYPMIMAFSQSAPQTRVEISPREMLAISQLISREFAPRFAKADLECPSPLAFSSQELLAISQEISREFSPRPQLEDRSSLVLLPVDPRRLHAYWHIAESSLRTVSKANPDKHGLAFDEQKPPVEEHLTLRIFTQSNSSLKTTDKPKRPGWFDIPIHRAQCRQDIILPIDEQAIGSIYSAAIGVCHGDHDFVALAYSNIAATPNPTINPDNSTLPDSIAQFIIPNMNTSSSMGTAVRHQEIIEIR